MTALNRKLVRDLWALKGQALAIALVITSGGATFVMSLSTLDSLKATQAVYYGDFRFAEAFASMKRAPESLRLRLEEIPGTDVVQTRVIAPATIEVEGYSDPIRGQLVSIPDHGQPLLNQLYPRRGRLVDSARDDEVIVHESFAKAHGFVPGDRITTVVNGRRKRLRIVGIALSPEYVFPIAPGDFIPDFASYGIMWMARTPLEAAFDMKEAFNDAAFTLTADAQLEEVLDRVDDVIRRYGGLGAYGRTDQVSHRYLSEEFRQLEQMATIYPVIFLGVAAFLLNVVITRLIRTEREQVATLKAFGYSSAAIGFHYVKLVLAIVGIGVVGGVAAGVRFGQGLSGMYMEFYRFPFLHYVLEPYVVISAAMVSVGAGLTGTLYSVRQAAGQPPAQAMRPEPPAKYRVSIVERFGARRWLSQPARMVVRNIERRPLKSLLTATGIAMSCAILMVGFFFSDTVAAMVRIQFGLMQRDDLAVIFVEPTSRRILHELESLPGVEHGEVFRAVPVRLRSENRDYRTSIQGVEPEGDLYRVLDVDLRPIAMPPSGILLTDFLAKFLQVGPGDNLTVEVLEGGRPVREVTVAGLVTQYVGVSAYMDIDALNRLMREGRAISGVYLAADSLHETAIYSSLKEAPRVAGVSVRKKMLKNFNETMAEQLLTFTFFLTFFAGTIAFGVVYNSARVALSEKGRELASLRVLGFTRGEISFILLGELAVLTLIAIPMGYAIGGLFCGYVVKSLETDLFRFPFVIAPSTYAFAATVVLVASVISAMLVRRELNHLDLVAVLKTKE
ncbi:MAG: ABC transporter permease [Acidobacteria bacterium]|nr:ABC transporter permease [Acidobacteriota bacterium]